MRYLGVIGVIGALGTLLLAGCGIDRSVSRQLGARCDDKSECDERCLVGDDFPGGLCSLTCADSAECPDGSVCADLEGGVCLFACDEADACAFLGESWVCSTVDRRGEEGQESACVGS